MNASSEVIEMDPKTRILTIRLMDALQTKPAYAERLGIEVTLKKARSTAT